MRPFLLILFCFCTLNIFSQNFIEKMDTPFEGVRTSSLTFADVEGDGDLDVFLNGTTNALDSPSIIATLYLNDGLGNYSEVIETPFKGGNFGDAAFADIDMDEDQDLLITGIGEDGISFSKLYLNDGSGNYSEDLDTPFDGAHTSSVSFLDVDGDNDLDVFITGLNNDNSGMSKLYTNDGMGNFSEVLNTPFLGVFDSAADFADVDGDNDMDILITGLNSPSVNPGLIAELYINDGSGNFVVADSTVFEPSLAGSVDFADLDNDGDQDVLITGQIGISSTPMNIAKMYMNDGSGNFTEVTGTSFDPVYLSDVGIADVDNDGDQDVLITGRSNIGFPNIVITKLYLNDGTGSFTELLDTPFEQVNFSAVAFADVDGDDDQDVLITGWLNVLPGESTIIAKLYINEEVTSTFTENGFGSKIKLFPNPVIRNELTLSINSDVFRNVQINIFDLKGRILKSQNEPIISGVNSISLDLKNLAKGSYIVHIQEGERIEVRKIVIQ